MPAPALSRRSSVLLTGIILVAGVSWAHARQNIRDAFFQVYPNAVGTVLDTVPSHPTHCGVCHFDFSGGGLRNPYGLTVEDALPSFPNNPNGRRQAIRSVEGLDADGDGFMALVEVTDTVNYANTPTFPGLTPANVSGVLNVDIAELQDHLVPTAGGDTSPPTVTVISPNGGETRLGNTGTTVQWTATDASGVARIDFELSTDNGATFVRVAENVGNAGTLTWFPPNRPSTTAIFRVIATDNVFNVGYDDSDAPFTISAPPGGGRAHDIA